MPRTGTLSRDVTPRTEPGFWNMELDWKRIWAKRWWVIGVLVVLYAAGFAVNHGPSMNNLGWVYLQLWGTQPTRDGQIFVFVPANKPAWTKFVPGQQWIKRRVGVTADGRIIFEGDNSEWSADNRDLMEPVPPDHVAGVVYCAISPRRIANCFTKQGRFDNRLEMAIPEKWIIYRKGTVVATHRYGEQSVTVQGLKYDLVPSGGVHNDPILVNKFYTKAYRIVSGVPRECQVGGVPIGISPGTSPLVVVEKRCLGAWRVRGTTIPILLGTLSMIADGDTRTCWSVPLRLPSPELVVDFGSVGRRHVVVWQNGHGLGDVSYDIATRQGEWVHLNPGMGGFKPSQAAVPRDLGEIECRYLRITNSMGSAWEIYEITAS